MEGLLNAHIERDLVDEFYHERYKSYVRAGYGSTIAHKLATTDTKEQEIRDDQNYLRQLDLQT